MNDDAASLLALHSLLTGSENSAGGPRAYETVVARSGEEALRQVLMSEFAVILLDVNMPGMDGFETAAAIHSHPRSASVPIIFITAYFADEINRLKGYQRGAVDYLFTPIIPQVLQSKVAVFVELAKQRLELQQKTLQLEELNQDLQVQRLRDLQRVNAALEIEVMERKQAEERARELATRDPLTKLANRRSLIERLDHAIAHSARHKESMALLFLDLDKFKSINDTLGHEVGDRLLIEVAARLTMAVRESDIVARLGGDEFVVLLEGVQELADPGRVAQKIVEANARPYEIGPHLIRSSASVGISLFPQDGASAQALMKNADLAMYHAKQQKRGSIQFFRDELNARMLERLELEKELHEAIAGEQFELRYQPEVDIPSGRVNGIEALLHWRHPRLGLISADRFISAAADYHLALPIAEWVISSACAQARRWRDAGCSSLSIPISVNVNTPQLQADLPAMVQNALEKHGAPPRCLQLEINESLLVRDPENASTVLKQLNDCGVGIAVADFGTGYSSLALLKTLPVRALKVDRSLLRDLDPGSANSADNSALVAAVINMARALSLKVVAKGVENDGQLALLKTLQCDAYQGYPFVEPLTHDELAPRLRAFVKSCTTNNVDQ